MTEGDAAKLAAYDAETSVLAAAHATKMAIKARERADPGKEAERQRAEQEKRNRLEFARQDLSFLRRLSPRQNRWRDVAAFDERVVEADARIADGEIADAGEACNGSQAAAPSVSTGRCRHASTSSSRRTTRP